MDSVQRIARASFYSPLGKIFLAINEIRRIHADASRLATLPRDRLEDMGISPRTEDNQRHSGQRGRIPPSRVW